MYKEHPSFENPDNENIKIWRYMDFTKFVAMLSTRSISFVRADKFDDPFEGSYSRANQRLRPVIYKDLPEHALKTFSAAAAQWRRYVAINCWHMNEYESAAMWKLYVKGDEGIAVQCTFKSLTDSFSAHSDDDIFVGKVKYIDYEKDWIPEANMFYPFMHKRKSFEHERELRALLCRLSVIDNKIDFTRETIQDVVLVSVDLETLIHAIYVSPTSPKWFYKVVTSVMEKFSLDKSVKQSGLSDDSPVY